MKSQETKGYIHILRIVLTLVAVCIILSASTYSVFASESAQNGDFFVENCNLTEEYSMLLSQEIGIYSANDPDPLKTASQNVLGVINLYRKQLIDLQSLPEAKTRLLSREAKLIYTKGLGAAKLTWIYYYNLKSLTNAELIAEIQSAYEGYMAQIDQSDESAILGASTESYAAKLNNTIYKRMLSELSQKGDSIASASIIAGGIERIEALESSDILAEQHAQIYESTKEELHLQRSKDLLYKELEDIFKVIRPGESFLENNTVALFNYRLSNAKSIREMNVALQSALDKLLETPQNQKYLYLFTSALRESISIATSKAIEDNIGADVTSLFQAYTLDFAKASAKDEISAQIYSGSGADNTELLRLEEKFKSEGGIIDSCLTLSDIEIEITRAQFVKLCYSALNETDSEIKIVLEPHDPPKFLMRTQSAYASAIESLFKLVGSLELESNCKALLSGLQAELKIILNESKAERFLLDHKPIISKTNDSLTLSDELELRQALSDYTRLEKEVSISLASQINSIAEKYNIVLSQLIRSKVSDDALYLDICEVFCNEIKNLPRNNIADYYNKCDLVLEKSDVLFDMIKTYRELVKSELYASYNASEREALVKVCRESADRLARLSLDDEALFKEDATEIGENAKVSLYRKNEIVRIRIAARSSSNTEIKSIVADANAKINASFNQNEMISIADKAIFKINRHLTADSIDIASEKLKSSIDAMRFLSADQKASFKSLVSTLQAEDRSTSLLCENLTVLQFVWDTFCEKLEQISQNAENENLTLSRKAHLDQLKKECDDLTSDLRSMIYLSTKESDDFYNKLSDLQTSFKSDIVSTQKSSDVEALYSKVLATLQYLENSAFEANLSNRKNELIKKMDIYSDAESKYSVENYNKILEILSAFKSDIATSRTVLECDEIYKNTLSAIESVSDLLDDAKQIAIHELESLVASYKKMSTLYSQDAFSSIESILDKAKREIEAYSSLSDIGSVNASRIRYLLELSSVKRDYASSSPDGLGFLAEGTAYPLQYDFNNGYWGLIYLPDSLPGESILTIMPLSDPQSDSAARIIRNAAKSKALKFYGAASSQYLKEIKRSSVALSLDISLSSGVELDSPFTLQMLLPDEYRDSTVLGIAFICEDGSVEFYSAEQRDALISATLTHLSEYYIIIERTIDLGWLIILICSIIAIELLIFAFLLLLRFKRKRKENSMFPLISSCFITPLQVTALTKIRPEGAISTTILLSVGALALGCAIALLARTELFALSGAKRSDTSHKSASSKKSSFLPKASVRKLLHTGTYALKEAQRSEFENEDIDYPSGTPQVLTDKAEILCPVGADESEAQYSDSDIEQIPDNDSRDLSEGESKHPRYRAEINLDVIAQKFSNGDLVTIDALKRKHLIPKKTDHLKVLARGALSKSLVVEAHDFSRAAEEMLSAVGGEAIRIRRS